MPALSDRFTLRGHQLRSRLIMAPMVTGFAEGHLATDAQVEWYREHARRGLGLVVVESTGILPDGIIMPRLLGLWDDAQVPSLARIASAIQAEGVPAILQLVHGGARSVRADPAVERIGASALPLLPGPAPRPMTGEEIQGVIEAFAAAAARAIQAGFDGVEIHAAHYYLISQFLSPLTNRMEAPWGGSLENRSRLGVEVVKAVRAAIGPDPLIFCRMHSVENLEGGLSTEEACVFARALEAAGVDVINASGIGHSSWGEWQGQPFLNTSSVAAKGAPGGGFAPTAHLLREAVSIPVVTVGKLGDSALAQGILDRGDADLIALARPLIADFAAAEKLLAGRDTDLQLCRECLSCFASIRKGPIRCSVNKDL